MDSKQSIRITNGEFCGRRCEALKGSLCTRYSLNILESRQIDGRHVMARCGACVDAGD